MSDKLNPGMASCNDTRRVIRSLALRSICDRLNVAVSEALKQTTTCSRISNEFSLIVSADLIANESRHIRKHLTPIRSSRLLLSLYSQQLSARTALVVSSASWVQYVLVLIISLSLLGNLRSLFTFRAMRRVRVVVYGHQVAVIATDIASLLFSFVYLFSYQVSDLIKMWFSANANCSLFACLNPAHHRLR